MGHHGPTLGGIEDILGWVILAIWGEEKLYVELEKGSKNIIMTQLSLLGSIANRFPKCIHP